MINKDICDKGFIWNPSVCECECDKLCDVGEYLDYKNCRFRKKLLINQLKYVRENNGTWDYYGKAFNSCTIYIVLLVIFLIISISI